MTLQWYRTNTCLYRDADYDQMPLAEQAVYRNLLDHASEQTERGTFRVDHLQLLANRVAHGNVDLLQSVITYCETEWREEDGTPHIVKDEKYYRFSTWAEQHGSPIVHPVRRAFARVRDRRMAAIIERDGAYCSSCGALDVLTVDHVFPIARGGTNDLDNLQILCRTCNSRKGTRV